MQSLRFSLAKQLSPPVKIYRPRHHSNIYFYGVTYEQSTIRVNTASALHSCVSLGYISRKKEGALPCYVSENGHPEAASKISRLISLYISYFVNTKKHIRRKV
jgi:hypothetical protein